MNNNYLIDTHCHMALTDDIDGMIMDADKNNVKDKKQPKLSMKIEFPQILLKLHLN